VNIRLSPLKEITLRRLKWLIFSCFSYTTQSCGAGKANPKAVLRGFKLLPADALKKAAAFPGPTPACCYSFFHFIINTTMKKTNDINRLTV
jgi:hypothetical protein